MVVVLRHVACETLGIIGEALAARGIETHEVRTFAGEAVPVGIDGFAGLVVMGGPMGVYETDQFPHLRDELRLIRSAIDAGKPVLGICLGSQLIAAALGARVYPGPHKEIGWYDVTLTEAAASDAVFGPLPQTFTAFVWHGDVFDLPDGATSLASTALTACQAFRYGSNVHGILFHMEVTPAIIDGMLTTFTDELRQTRIDAAPIRDAVATHLAQLQRIGAGAFGRWADLLTQP